MHNATTYLGPTPPIGDLSGRAWLPRFSHKPQTNPSIVTLVYLLQGSASYLPKPLEPSGQSVSFSSLPAQNGSWLRFVSPGPGPGLDSSGKGTSILRDNSIDS